VFRAAGIERPDGDHDVMYLPRVMAWTEPPEMLDQLQVAAALDADIGRDAANSLAAGFKWERVEDDPALTMPPKWAWRNADGIVKPALAPDAKPDKTFRTQYSQTWSYVDLALRHIYECARLLALRGQQLREAGADATDSRLCRLALLPDDLLLIVMASHLMPTYLGTPVDVDVPSHKLTASPLDAITRDFQLDLKSSPPDANADASAIARYRTLKMLDFGGGKIFGRPTIAIYVIAAHLMAAPTGKDRTRRRDKLWKINEGRNCIYFRSRMEYLMRWDLLLRPRFTGNFMQLPYDDAFLPGPDGAVPVPPDGVAAWVLPTIVPKTAQYTAPANVDAAQPENDDEESLVDNRRRNRHPPTTDLEVLARWRFQKLMISLTFLSSRRIFSKVGIERLWKTLRTTISRSSLNRGM
jgi:hypothetical protein